MKNNPLEVPDVAKKHQPKYSLELLWKFPDLVKWLNQISRRGNFDNFFYISDYKEEKERKIRLRFFTKEHSYSLSVRLPSEERKRVIETDEKGKVLVNADVPVNDGYLGCIGQVRKSRAGEDWNRGNDLADGNYSQETWQEIKDDILAYELVKVVRNSPDKDEK